RAREAVPIPPEGLLESPFTGRIPHRLGPFSLPLGLLQDSGAGPADLGPGQVSGGGHDVLGGQSRTSQALLQIPQVAPLPLGGPAIEEGAFPLLQALGETAEVAGVVLHRQQGEPEIPIRQGNRLALGYRHSQRRVGSERSRLLDGLLARLGLAIACWWLLLSIGHARVLRRHAIAPRPAGQPCRRSRVQRD